MTTIEVPEIRIWADQIRDSIVGRRVATATPEFTDNIRDAGYVNTRIDDFHGLDGVEITGVRSRGFTMILDCYGSRVCHLVITPERGGEVAYRQPEQQSSSRRKPKNSLTFRFEDGASLVFRLSGLGTIQFLPDEPSMKACYVYHRDFLSGISPLEPLFTAKSFASAISQRDAQIKSVLIGNRSPVVGIGNAILEDAAFRSRIHPRRKATDLSEDEMRELFSAICTVVDSRVAEGGKEGFADIYGEPGRYVPAMGPERTETGCPECGGKVETIRVAGGRTRVCPACQIEKT